MSAEKRAVLDAAIGVQSAEQAVADDKTRAVAEGVGFAPDGSALASASHTDAMTESLQALIRQASAAPTEQRFAVLLYGVAKLIRAARAEGPGVVEHLAGDIEELAISNLPAAKEAK